MGASSQPRSGLGSGSTRAVRASVSMAMAVGVFLASCAEGDATDGAEPTDPTHLDVQQTVVDQERAASERVHLDASAQWRRIELQGATDAGEPFVVQGILIDAEAGGVVDLDHPAPMRFGMQLVTLDSDRSALVLAVAGSLGACHYLDEVETDLLDDRVVLVPRLASKHGEHYGGSVSRSGEPIPSCPQPGVALAVLVTLDEPLDDRPVEVLRCTGAGRSDCETMSSFGPQEIPLVATADITCVPVQQLMEVQRDLFERLDRCDLDALPMLGIWEDRGRAVDVGPRP